MLLHASSVAIDNKGVLLSGPPGAGKSDLALRLIDGGARLIADDQTLLQSEEGRLVASAPPAIAGFMEVRHVGLLRVPCADKAPIALYVELAEIEQKLERLPERETIDFLGVAIRRIRLPAFAVSTPAKIRAALSCIPVEGR